MFTCYLDLNLCAVLLVTWPIVYMTSIATIISSSYTDQNQCLVHKARDTLSRKWHGKNGIDKLYYVMYMQCD